MLIFKKKKKIVIKKKYDKIRLGDIMYGWLAIVILLTLIEILTTNLVTVWFVASALLALLATFFTDSFFIQFAIFVIFGVLFLVTTRPFLLKIMHKNREKTNIDRIVGMRGKIIQSISTDEVGEVKVDGKIWFAISDEPIALNATVEILEIIGTKLKVKEVK